MFDPLTPPEDLPLTAPALVVLAVTDAEHLYRIFEDEATARAYWTDKIAQNLKRGERAFLFVKADLVAFAANL